MTYQLISKTTKDAEGVEKVSYTHSFDSVSALNAVLGSGVANFRVNYINKKLSKAALKKHADDGTEPSLGETKMALFTLHYRGIAGGFRWAAKSKIVKRDVDFNSKMTYNYPMVEDNGQRNYWLNTKVADTKTEILELYGFMNPHFKEIADVLRGADDHLEFTSTIEDKSALKICVPKTESFEVCTENGIEKINIEFDWKTFAAKEGKMFLRAGSVYFLKNDNKPKSYCGVPWYLDANDDEEESVVAPAPKTPRKSKKRPAEAIVAEAAKKTAVERSDSAGDSPIEHEEATGFEEGL